MQLQLKVTILCTFILLLIIVVERFVRMLLTRAKQSIDMKNSRSSIKCIILDSLTRPLSMFIAQ